MNQKVNEPKVLQNVNCIKYSMNQKVNEPMNQMNQKYYKMLTVLNAKSSQSSIFL